MVKKIMVVDDDHDIAVSVKQTLENTGDGYKVIPAGNGRECFEFLHHNDLPDLILLDIMMPEMSGWEVFDKLKQNPVWKDIPVVFLTVRKDKTAERAGSFLGDDYIEKPFDIDELKKRIDKILSG
jgi:CheY-like chemotaxis protein